MMFEEKDSFGEAFQKWIEAIAALNKNSSGQAGDDLSVDVSVRVRMIPKQPDVFLWDFYLIREGLVRCDVNEHIVAVVQWRNAQTMKMQVCLLGKLIMQRHS